MPRLPRVPKSNEKENNCSVVYCLKNLISTNSRQTYVGVTKDVTNRLDQHNGLKSGGAKSTKGGSWGLCWMVKGFSKRSHCLQLEWRLHNKNWSSSSCSEGKYQENDEIRKLIQRLYDLCRCFEMERWTSNSPLSSEISRWLVLQIEPSIYETFLLEAPKLVDRILDCGVHIMGITSLIGR
jgi:predicted GIY-YIG superfamily endonuclease